MITQEIKAVTDKGGTITKEEAGTIVKDKTQGMDILKKAGKRRYVPLLTRIRNKYALGIDLYPTSMTKAYEIVEGYAVSH